jgi:hypothetical protein
MRYLHESNLYKTQLTDSLKGKSRDYGHHVCVLAKNERRREDLNLRNPLGVNLISSEAH